MNIEDRISALSGKIHDCAAAIDAARVLAKITGKPQVLYREFGDPASWIVRSVDDRAGEDWGLTGGVYYTDDTRSGIQTNPELTPELAEARGVRPYIHTDTFAAEYRRFVVGGPSRPIDD